MHISEKDSYENASMVLISHEDKDYSNSVFKLICQKSRKLQDNGKFTKWSDLNFKFEITNKDMEFGSNGNYRMVSLSRSEFLSWMLSLQLAVKDPDVYNKKVTVKRRLHKNDFIIKFALSEKLNCNAILMCIVSNQSTYSKIGINGLLFNQFLLQMGKMAVDILNFEMNFDNSILMYKNNQNVEYQSSQLELHSEQNARIIDLLTKNNERRIIHPETHLNPNMEEIETSDIIVEEDTIDESDPDVFCESDNLNEIENKNISINNDDFTNNLNDNIKNTKLEQLFGMRQDDIDNPKEIDLKKVDDKTTLMKLSELNGTGIELFSGVFTEAQKGDSVQEKGISYYFSEVLGNSDYFLPDCVESDFNSLLYLSQLQFSNILTQYNADKSLPDFVDIPLFYKTENHDWEYDQVRNMYDLIAIYVYMIRYSKSFKVRLTDAIQNKEVFTRCFRLIFEPVYMTYLASENIIFDEKMEEAIFRHYKSLNNIDFFDDWNKHFDELSLNKPNDKDIKLCISDLKDYTDIIKGITLKANHTNYVKKEIVKLPYKNKFNREHIIETVKLESYLADTENITSDVLKLAYLKLEIDPNPVVMEFLTKVYIDSSKDVIILDKLIDNSKKDNDRTALTRLLNKNLSDDSPDKETLILFVEEVGEKDIDLTKLPDNINIHSIPDDILLAMSLWKPTEDFRIKQFSHLINQMKNCWRTKSDVITEYMTDIENNKLTDKVENSVDWGTFV